MDGIAADVEMQDSQNKLMAKDIALDLIGPQGGVGHERYSTIVHIDFGPEGRTW
jgi:uncharacterized protein YcbK (DUF882 family)